MSTRQTAAAQAQRVLQIQMHEELLGLYGLPISDSAVLAFLDRHGFKAPKALHKSAHAEGSDWLTHKKAGVDLLLQTQPFNPRFPPLPAERKGMLVPRLVCAIFRGQHIALPAGLSWNASAEEAGRVLGAPWWARNGADERMWRVPMADIPLVETLLSVDLAEPGVHAPWVGIRSNVNWLNLEASPGVPMRDVGQAHRPSLMLLAWLLLQLGHAPVSSTAAEAMAAVTRALDELGRAYILRDDFGPLGHFAWAYGLSVNLPQGLRDDYQHIVGSSDDLPSDAQLAQLQQVFAQRLAEFEAADRASAAPGT